VTKTFQDQTLFGISNFGHWKLFDICDLIFVISELQTKQIPSGDKTKPGHLGQDSLLLKFRRHHKETFEKCPILFKAKKGENFNHRNTWSILRIKN